MKRHFIAALACGALVATTASGGALAQTEQKSAGGFDYTTGGVTASELVALEKQKDQYSLWLTTAAEGSGAFLSDAQVKIVDMKKDTVLETTMMGPWLLADLPPGRYTVEAKFQDQVLKRTVSIGKDGLRQAILYFDSPAQVSPDWVSPFEQSPYAG